MSEVEVFVRPGCPWCDKAVNWFTQYKVEHKLVRFTNIEDKMAFYQKHAAEGVRTLPQIFIDGVRIGGWSDFVTTQYKADIEKAAE